MQIKVTEKALREIYGLKEVNETLTWKQVIKKYANKDIYLSMQRDPFWSWADPNIPEFTISHSANYELENFMTAWEWQDFYGKQGISLFKR